MRTSFKLAAAAALLALALPLGGCSEKMSDGEAVELMSELIPVAEQVNELVWGEGLEANIDEAIEPYEPGRGSCYYPVAEGVGYENVSQLRELVNEVYSPNYATIISGIAFDGSEDLKARYIDYEGELYVNINANQLNLRTVIDPESAKVVKSSGSRATISVEYEYDGAPAGDLEVELVLSQEGWRIDSPTY